MLFEVGAAVVREKNGGRDIGRVGTQEERPAAERLATVQRRDTLAADLISQTQPACAERAEPSVDAGPGQRLDARANLHEGPRLAEAQRDAAPDLGMGIEVECRWRPGWRRAG
jgi:hypothetical protein